MAPLQLNQPGPPLPTFRRKPTMTFTAFEIITADEARYVPARVRHYEATDFRAEVNPRTGRIIVRYSGVNPLAVESVAGPRLFQDPEPACEDGYKYLGLDQDGLATYRVPWSF